VRTRADEDGHVGPRHVVVQVSLPEEQGHVLDLGRGRHERTDLDPAVVVDP
jgi:hypothetical protein